MGNTIKVNNTNQMAIQQKKPANATQPKAAPMTIAIVDNTTVKQMYIDNDDIPDISHGDVVKRFIKEGLPDAKIKMFETVANKDNSISGEQYNKALTQVIAAIDNGEKFDALNLSQSTFMSYAAISKALGKKITPINLAENRDEIRSFFRQQSIVGQYTQGEKQLENLEKIIAKGVPVYIAAGNEGNESFNPFSIVKGIKTVGAADKTGYGADFSANNSLITNGALGIFDVTKIKDKDGKIGYDITNDGTVDVYPEQLSAPSLIDETSGLQGTSLATPKALAEELKRQK